MKNLLTSSRFWIMLAILIAGFVLAVLDKVTGQQVVTLMGGILAGFGIGKIPGGTPVVSKMETTETPKVKP